MVESQQLVNCAKCFLAVTLYTEGNGMKGIELLEDLIDEYIGTVDEDKYHPFLESSYQQLGNMAFRLKNKDKALEAYRCLLKCRERIHPADSKELIRPLMQIQRLSASNDDITEATEVGLRVNQLLIQHVNEIDNNLVMNSGNLEGAEKQKLENELNSFKQFRLDTCFTLLNLYQGSSDFENAQYYAKEHTRVTVEVYKKEHKCYAYALFLEVGVMRYFPNLDHTETLRCINEALQISIKIGQNKKLDPFLARLYEEKGHVLRMLGGDVAKPNDYNVQALQSFNSAFAIMCKTQEQTRLPMVERMIAELSANPLITDKVEDMGKFDTECIAKYQEGDLFADTPAGEEDPEAAAEQADEDTALMLFGLGAVAAAAGIYAYIKWKK